MRIGVVDISGDVAQRIGHGLPPVIAIIIGKRLDVAGAGDAR